MPILTGWGWLIPSLGICAEVALLAVLAYGRHWRKWPALSSFIAAHTLMDALLALLQAVDAATGRHGDTIPALYFWTFWLGTAALALLEAWIIFEVASAIAPAARPILRMGIPLVLVASFAIAAAVADFNLPTLKGAIRTIVTDDQAVTLALLIGFITWSSSAELLRLRSNRRELLVSIGFLLLLIGDCVVSTILGYYPQFSLQLSCYQGVIFVGCAAVWGIAFWSTANQQTLDISPAALRRCLDALTALGEETTGVK